MSYPDDERLLTALNSLLLPQFEQVLIHVGLPREHLPGTAAAQGLRAVDVIAWMRQAPKERRALLAAALAKVGASLHATPQASAASSGSTPDDDVRLDDLYQERDAAIAAADTARISALNAEILAIKREKRVKGQLETGDFLGDGRYKLVERRGKGGFASVWKAWDRTARRAVAVKVLHPEQAEDQSRRERFFRGARQMATLDHPGIVRIIEPHGEDQGRHYFVMEFIDGEDLDHAVRGGRVDGEHGLALVLQVADALQYAHGRGLVHRDVTPSNILIDREGRPHLTDFDLVRAEDTSGGTHTSAMGKYIYAPPELMSKPQDADARSDVFSLGMTLVFVYAGRPLTDDVLYEQRAYLAGLECPPQVRAALPRAIARRMQERFATVAEFSVALAVPGVPAAASAIVERVAPIGRRPGEVWVEPAMGLTLVWIPPGEFLMGSSKKKGEPGYDPEAMSQEMPTRRVRISDGFWIGQHPVTNEQYGRFVAHGGAEPGEWRNRRFNSPQQPVVGVSAIDARAFCKWATKHAGLTGEIAFDLPTEAEWEFAARGEEGRRYPWGQEKPTTTRAVWGLATATGAAAVIGGRPRGATPLGVHDMAGNVWEWCLDDWIIDYHRHRRLDVDPCAYSHHSAPRVSRGGCWDMEIGWLRAAHRFRIRPGASGAGVGFRVVCRRFRQDVDL